MPKNSLSRTFVRFAHGYKRFFILAIAASGLSILFQFLMPQVIRITVDSVIGDRPFALPASVMSAIDSMGGRDFLRTHLLFCALFVIVFSLLSGIFNFLSRMGVARGTEGTIRTLRNTLFAHVQRLPFAWHTQNQTGDIIQRCTSDVDVVRNFIANQLIEVLRTLILITTALTLMFSMNAALSFVALIFIPIVMLYSGIYYRRISRQFRDADEAEGDLTVAVQENLTGVRVVRAFGRERYEVDRFDEKNNTFANKWINLGYTLGAYWGLGDLVTGLQVLSVIVFGSLLAVRGSITLGEFLVFVSYNQTLAWPVRSLGRTLSEMSKTGVSLTRLYEILVARAEDEEENPGRAKPDLTGDIVFDNVTFRYETQSVLKNLSFTVPHGKTFGILGATGAGKSTITYLLNRLYDLPPDGGRITIGGVDLRDIDRDHLRRGVGVVLQEPFLFSKTIEQNIGIAVQNPTLEKVRRCAAIADVDESIIGFANGYDTMVGERGVTLSGGQKQRVAIARTLMLDAPVLVFDDSLSAVDLETDARIRDSLRQSTGDSTVILISHRISTLMHADCILVLEDGAVADIGTHQELISRPGVYRRVFEMQSDAAKGGPRQ
ncbi:MAG TPA: ABC transporter ATP-binding protein [Candidatus Ventrousia excrementavium]|uniref:ABC transporter ATP-binding protein n=1 Tax=Candidatus Ventrousia excrementavium TaxID=2840961 RepID=A0A9D1IRS7_9CLOT|nr:ABC transporter ATP-binding protein [Candidatus Ventrousia excrementavium]